LAALDAAETWAIDGAELVLFDGSEAELLRFMPAASG
jgi:hypothetical protein